MQVCKQCRDVPCRRLLWYLGTRAIHRPIQHCIFSVVWADETLLMNTCGKWIVVYQTPIWHLIDTTWTIWHLSDLTSTMWQYMTNLTPIGLSSDTYQIRHERSDTYYRILHDRSQIILTLHDRSDIYKTPIWHLLSHSTWLIWHLPHLSPTSWRYMNERAPIWLRSDTLWPTHST